jgi:hypothetical protein
MKYDLIHTTKTGGTAFFACLLDNYSGYFSLQEKDIKPKKQHSFLCGDSENPISIFRDPTDRFNSMFSYWKYGSSKWIRSPLFLEETKNIGVNDFVSLVRNNRTDILHTYMTWDVHYAPQFRWFTGDHQNIIIINYQNDLQSSLVSLLDFLQIPDKGVQLKKVNASKKRRNYFEDLNQESLDWFHEYFKEDLEIQQKIKLTPEVFKKVI